MASMNTRLNIEKLDGNIFQKHGGSKQVGFKQLGPGVETGVHGVHDEKRVWFEVELQGAQGDREAKVFQVSNDDTAVAQRWLEDKQPEEKTNTNCLVKEQEKEYQTGWKIKTGNVLDSCNQRSIQQCTKSEVAKHLGVAGLQQQNGLVKETSVTLLAKVELLAAKNLIGANLNGMSNPYAIITCGTEKGGLVSIRQQLLPNVNFHCLMVHGSRNPMWGEEFNFLVDELAVKMTEEMKHTLESAAVSAISSDMKMEDVRQHVQNEEGPQPGSEEYPGKFYCSRMNNMNKPTYVAICTYSPTKPVLIFVSSRRQTRLTVLDLIQIFSNMKDAAADEHRVYIVSGHARGRGAYNT
ncbi:zinc finger, CCHC-type containing protein [Tanacetum coccineum]